jgi:3-hydroxybutyryl-CoA dehydrogenase
MASGIVEVCARSGYDVVFRARTDDKVAAVRKRVEGSLAKALERGKIEAGDRDAALDRITGTTELADLADCDLVIEAVVEDLAVKKALFAELDRVLRPGAVLATTTSSLRWSSARGRPGARRTWWGCTGSTRHRHAAGRGGADGDHGRGRRGHRAGGLRPDRQARRPVR